MVDYRQGDRVKVSIEDANRWAMGAANNMQGKAGTVLEVKKEILVELDEPPEKWWEHQQPGRLWWFTPEELTRTGRLVLPASVGFPGTLEK